MAEIDRYDYELPPELIAQHPLPNRSDARLLVIRRGAGVIEHFHVRDLPDLLSPADTLVLNDTKVVPARLTGVRTATGGRWQGLFLSADGNGNWEVLGKTRGKLSVGETITLHGDEQGGGRACDEQLTVVAKLTEGRWAVRPRSLDNVWEILERVGHVPLPPYIRGGEMVPSDLTRYQTVFAQTPGAVAAPTAGLHFTNSLLQQVRDRGLDVRRVTLHVGIGTFRPVSVERLDDHPMHAEFAMIDDETAAALVARREAGGRIVAVGTTVVRTLESAALAAENAECAETETSSLRAGTTEDGGPSTSTIRGWSGETRLFIRPPYRFRAIDVLLTNFHLPKSTLLVLVRTFGGDELMRWAYDEAIRERYRFYSYGDAMLILP
ncbi:MAG TPA: tRNA preQ1(34) S-adenosylmethionine ribosyltransferase-isomerase QueA [Pirellulaceae bacterium]|nr:tRNA preQ1(34) S-adenosylmethionine ribosyltransferase-isomerase QueA [Pirellulaceae bacterium]